MFPKLSSSHANFQTLALILILAIGIQLVDVTEARRMKPEPSDLVLDPSLDQSMSTTLVQFGAMLMHELVNPEENLVFSPISIHSALGMVLLGATDQSTTEKELTKLLGNCIQPSCHEAYKRLLAHFAKVNAKGLKTKKEQEAAIEAAKNSTTEGNYRYHNLPNDPIVDIWTMGLIKGEFEPKKEYLANIREYYNSSVERVVDSDEQSKDKILDKVNKWAKEAGYQSSPIQRQDLNKKFSMILTSAIRTEAFWFDVFSQRKFDELFYNHGLKSGLVKDRDGLVSSDFSGRFVEFTMDRNSSFEYYNAEVRQAHGSKYEALAKLEFRMIQVPLEGGLSYVIIEPISNGTGKELAKLALLLSVLDGEALADAMKIFDSPQAEREIDSLAMPPFKFETNLNLVDTLKQMGLRRVFDPYKAELGKLSVKGQSLDKAMHKAMVEVNKKGLKAAGLTTIRAIPLMGRFSSHRIDLTVQHPFLFMIRYSKIPLFMGHVVEV